MNDLVVFFSKRRGSFGSGQFCYVSQEVFIEFECLVEALDCTVHLE